MVAHNPSEVAADPFWVVRIVSAEGDTGRRQLDRFCDPESSSPVTPRPPPSTHPDSWTGPASTSARAIPAAAVIAQARAKSGGADRRMRIVTS